MKLNNILFAQLLLLGIAILGCQQNSERTDDNNSTNSVTMDKIEKKEKLLRHMVIFKFKEEADEESVNKLNASFNALADAIPVIKDFEWGINDSPEDFHQDFTHCYLLTFASEEDRDSIYTPHPAHQAFVKSLGPYLEKVFVVDYWTNP